MEHEQWQARLPESLEQARALWGLPPVEPLWKGECSWVAPVDDDTVLKVGWIHSEALHEAEGLSVWAGDGAVRLIRHHRLEHTDLLLLERLSPGTSGWDLPAEEQDELVALMARRLWREPAPGHPFRPLTELTDMWTRHEPSSPLQAEGFALFRELARSAPTEVLLHTDLHPGNVLRAEREPWLVIDPKPYVGDPAYDVLQHLMSCRHFEADPPGLVRRMADLLDLDHDRLRGWAFARCLVELRSQPHLLDAARRLAPG